MLCTLLLALAASGGPSQAPVLDLVEVRVESRRDLWLLRELVSDLDPHAARGARESVRVVADDEEQAQLRAAGLDFRVVQEDLTRFYAERAAGDLPPGALGLGAGAGSMGGFRTLAEMETFMIHLAVQEQSFVSLPFTIGTSHEGRPVRAFRVSTTPQVHDASKPTVWYDALHHAREPMSGEALLRFAEELAVGHGVDPEMTRLVETRQFVFLPCVNPDGYEFNRELAPGGGGMWRKNKRLNSGGTLGVDLNRNYDWQWGPMWPGSSSIEGHSDYRGPAPFSEPEAAALRDFAAQELPRVAVSMHSYADAWVFPWGYDAVLTPDDAVFRDLASRAASEGWTSGAIWEALYFANGSSLDWLYGTHGTYALAVEIGDAQDGYWPSPARVDELYAQAREGLLAAARSAGAWMELRDLRWGEVLGDGDLYREAGERWALYADLENIGLDALSGSVAVGATSPVFAPLGGALPVQLAPGARALFGPLEVDIASGAVGGVDHPFELQLDWGGLTTPVEVSERLGEPRVLARDDMQAADFGWAVDVPGVGAWERAVPAATAAQPGADASGQPGGKCWVTGAKGGPADANDVDGVTRLVTPIFRAAHVQHLALELQVAFHASGADDALRVEVSNDAGLSWVPVEELPPTSGWEAFSLRLDTVITLSDSMRLRFTAEDLGADGTVEAALDDLVLESDGAAVSLGLWGAPRLGEPLRYALAHPATASQPYRLLWSLSSGPGVAVPGIGGRLFLTGTVRTLLTGTADSEGGAEIPSRIPDLSSLKNTTVHLQVLSGEGTPYASYSNKISFTIR